MFSQLGPLFKTHLRQAEKSDTRLEIKRDEKHDQGKKQEFEEKEDVGPPMWEDSTQVSVEALRTFLLEFLKTRGEAAPEENIAADTSAYAGLRPEERAPASPIAARAVKAYATMAVYSHEPPPLPPQEPPKQQAEQEIDLADLLRADELRTIHVLIAELEQLSRRGLQVLMIEKAETFLEALVQAVRLEKSKG